MHLLSICLQIASFAAAMCLNGCEAQKHPTDLTLRIALTSESKAPVVAVLDRITSERGWKKTGSAPGLDEIAKRKVTFWSYGRTEKEMLLTITDIKKESELEVRAYFEPSISGTVEEVASKFATEARSVPGVSSVVQERRQR
jgi:hypothetical protein